MIGRNVKHFAYLSLGTKMYIILTIPSILTIYTRILLSTIPITYSIYSINSTCSRKTAETVNRYIVLTVKCIDFALVKIKRTIYISINLCLILILNIVKYMMCPCNRFSVTMFIDSCIGYLSRNICNLCHSYIFLILI